MKILEMVFERLDIFEVDKVLSGIVEKVIELV